MTEMSAVKRAWKVCIEAQTKAAKIFWEATTQAREAHDETVAQAMRIYEEVLAQAKKEAVGKCPECGLPATHPSGLCRDCHQSKLETEEAEG